MQVLWNGIGRWCDTIRRATGASTVSMQNVPDDGFILRAKWANGEYTRHFSKDYVFGGTRSLNEGAWHTQKKVCEYAREFMREVLHIRGAL